MPSPLFTAAFPESCTPDPVRCSSCNHTSLVPSNGPASFNSGGILFILEAPGENDDRESIPFIDASGQEFNKLYLPLAGLARHEITITNTVKCRPPGNRTPAPSQIRACSDAFLIHEIACMRPSLIVPMGGVALRFINIRTAHYFDGPKNLNLEAHHGRIFFRSFDFLPDVTFQVFPVYHPAAGLRDGSKMTQSFEDFLILREYLEGNAAKAFIQDAYSLRDYKEITSPSEYDRYASRCFASTRSIPWYTSIDTEDDEDGSMYSVQISHAPGTAIFVDGKNRPLLNYINDTLPPDTCDMTTVFHYAFHDWARLTSILGWQFDINQTADTLQEAFQSGNLPKKLKALAYRLCGVTMTSFHDLVYPYSVAKAVEFLTALSTHPKLQPEPCYGKKGQLLKKTINNPIAPDINRMLRCIKNTIENPDEDVKPYPVWKKWQEFLRDENDDEIELSDRRAKKLPYIKWLLDEKIDRMPKFSIRHVPRHLAVEYGCRDADLTGRVWLELRRVYGDKPMKFSDVAIKKEWLEKKGE